jgi:multidrug resistance efflux pump
MRPPVYFHTAIVLFFLSGCSYAPTVAGNLVLIKGAITAEHITLISGATGEVRKITKGPGDHVTKDELLLRLDPKDSAGELGKARENLKKLDAEEKKAKDELDRTTAELSYSRGRYLTFSSLYTRGAVARREVDRLRDEWEFAEDQHKKAESWYSDAAAGLAEAEIGLKRAEDHYGSVLILSPWDGYVTRLLTWEGGYLLLGEEMMVIARAGEVYFRGKIDADAPASLGEEAVVLPLDISTGAIHGYVARIDSDAAGNRIVTVRIFPEKKKDIVNIGKNAWAFLYIPR